MRKIIHIDMDAFYASVEQRDHPSYRGKPVIVGGDPNKRGVVSTCSYEARKYGIHSAMSSKKAYQLCPHGIFVYPRFSAYQEASGQIRDIFSEYTDLVEPLSLDEAFLDVTENKKNIPKACFIAMEIKRKIKEKINLTASAGISYNKFLAKVASDVQKPDGLTVVTPEEASSFLENLPIGRFFGVGKVTEKKMKHYGIYTGKDLKKFSLSQLIRLFGKSGEFYYYIVRGIDNRPVEPVRDRKSIGRETTFTQDIENINEMKKTIKELCEDVAITLKKENQKAKTITLKIKFYDFKQITRSITMDEYIMNLQSIIDGAFFLLQKVETELSPVRLLGVSLSNLEDKENIRYRIVQQTLPFPELTEPYYSF